MSKEYKEIVYLGVYKIIKNKWILLKVEECQPAEFKELHRNNIDFSYCSFIHYVDSDVSISEIIKKKNLGIKNNFCEHNRGYTIYYS